MKYLPYKTPGFFGGLGFVSLISAVSVVIAGTPTMKALSLSPLIIGMLIGAVLGNTVRDKIPTNWSTGILYSAKIILKLAIILYGFRITFEQIASVGLSGFIVDAMDGIQDIDMMMNAPLPFPYVHLVNLLVHFSVLFGS